MTDQQVMDEVVALRKKVSDLEDANSCNRALAGARHEILNKKTIEILALKALVREAGRILKKSGPYFQSQGRYWQSVEAWQAKAEEVLGE